MLTLQFEKTQEQYWSFQPCSCICLDAYRSSLSPHLFSAHFLSGLQNGIKRWRENFHLYAHKLLKHIWRIWRERNPGFIEVTENIEVGTISMRRSTFPTLQNTLNLWTKHFVSQGYEPNVSCRTTNSPLLKWTEAACRKTRLKKKEDGIFSTQEWRRWHARANLMKRSRLLKRLCGNTPLDLSRSACRLSSPSPASPRSPRFSRSSRLSAHWVAAKDTSE